jgi:hypothetical protein
MLRQSLRPSIAPNAMPAATPEAPRALIRRNPLLRYDAFGPKFLGMWAILRHSPDRLKRPTGSRARLADTPKAA